MIDGTGGVQHEFAVFQTVFLHETDRQLLSVVESHRRADQLAAGFPADRRFDASVQRRFVRRLQLTLFVEDFDRSPLIDERNERDSEQISVVSPNDSTSIVVVFGSRSGWKRSRRFQGGFFARRAVKLRRFRTPTDVDELLFAEFVRVERRFGDRLVIAARHQKENFARRDGDEDLLIGTQFELVNRFFERSDRVDFAGKIVFERQREQIAVRQTKSQMIQLG